MSNDVAMCTYHDITMHNDVTMNLFYYVCCQLSELRRRHQNSIFNRFLLKTFHALLTFIYFCYFYLFFGLCLLLLLVSLDVDPVLFVLDLHMKYTVEMVPLCMYFVWFVIM